MNAEVPVLTTKVKLYHDASGKAELLGFADMVIGGSFVIKGIRILKGKPTEDKPGGPFISFPSKKGSNGSDKYFDIAHPVTSEAYEAAKESVFAAFEDESKKGGSDMGIG